MECRWVLTQGRQGESAPASGKRSAQSPSGVDRRYQVVVPLGFASLPDRLWAHGQAATVHKTWDASHPLWDARRRIHGVRRADGRAGESPRESDRRFAWPETITNLR